MNILIFFLKYFNTLRHLKLIQIVFRFKPRIIQRRKVNPSRIHTRVHEASSIYFINKKELFNPPDEFNFLNVSRRLNKVGWNNPSMSLLWNYNQNYFDWLISKDHINHADFNQKIIGSWIRNNPEGSSISWDPYPTSLRIVNWIKYFLITDKRNTEQILSLYNQSAWLISNIEWHLLANHLISNAKALIFSGLFFNCEGSKNFLNKGIKILDQQLQEQILLDGGHFELSPMYHSIILEDLLDILNIFDVYSYENPLLLEKIKRKASLMIFWLSKMLITKQDFAFFNDSCGGIASKFSELESYANRLGLNYEIHHQKENSDSDIFHSKDSGFIRFENNKFISLMDVGEIGASYQPGHAHADTLSFETSILGKKFLTNSGISTYEDNSTRSFQRSTISHNTVVINNKNSSEVWSSFRVAKRAKPFDLNIDHERNKISCKHDGYKRIISGAIHARSWTYNRNSFSVEDRLSGSFSSASCFFYFHPDWSIKFNRNKIVCFLNEIEIEIKTNSKSFELIDADYFPEFGKKVKNKCLKINFDQNHIKTSFEIKT